MRRSSSIPDQPLEVKFHPSSVDNLLVSQLLTKVVGWLYEEEEDDDDVFFLRGIAAYFNKTVSDGSCNLNPPPHPSSNGNPLPLPFDPDQVQDPGVLFARRHAGGGQVCGEPADGGARGVGRGRHPGRHRRVRAKGQKKLKKKNNNRG